MAKWCPVTFYWNILKLFVLIFDENMEEFCELAIEISRWLN